MPIQASHVASHCSGFVGRSWWSCFKGKLIVKFGANIKLGLPIPGIHQLHAAIIRRISYALRNVPNHFFPN